MSGINVFAICEGEDNGKWWLVDAGFPGSFVTIRDAVAKNFGTNARPEAILLTHGHVDHVGAGRDLAVYFDVKIYAHVSELPFLNGTLDYPPADASVGGPMGLIAPFLSTKGHDLGEAISDIANAALPTGWEVIETPGHTPGHISFWHEPSKTLIAGDACMTMGMHGWRGFFSTLAGQKWVMPPPYAFTMDWIGVRRSLRKIHDLGVQNLYCGHGKPRLENTASALEPERMHHLAEWSQMPRNGRYVSDPVRVLEDGTLSIPPKPRDPVMTATKVLGIAACIGIGYYLWRNKKDKG
jgi:glyoxylase-like metal-dependent hydrolase (beta-lactamase superfamily II)